MGPQEDYIETVVTCEGDYHDPELHKRLEEFRQSLQDLLYTGEDKLILKKVEPWNSVRVTFKISREAAFRLKQLAQQGNATLRQLGVLAVQIQGDQAISLTIAGRNNERTELIIQTSSTPGPPTVSFSDPILPGGEELNSPSPSNVEATRKNIADYLRQGQALQQGSNIVETLFGPGALGQNSDVFRSPSLVASSQSGHPYRSGGAVSSSPSTPPSTTAISPSLPYLSTFPQGRSPPGFSQGSAFPGPPISSPGPSSGPMGMKFPPPGFPQQQDMGPYPPMDLMGLPPPPPYPHSTAVVNNISRPARTVTASSPLLVNLLQTDPMGVGMNSMSPMKMLPPSGEGGPPPKKKRRPRKKTAATATVTSGSLLEEEQPQPGLASSPVPEPSPVPVPLDAPPSVPVPLPASSSSQDADNPSMDEEHPFLNPADPNAVFPPSSHRMSPELPVIPLTSSAVGLELGLPTEQPEAMDTCESVEATPVVSETLVSPVQQTPPMEIDAVEMNHGDGKLVNPVTGDLEAVDTTSDLSPVKERDQASLGLEIPAQEELLAQTCTVITTTTSQSVTLSQPVPQTAAPAVTAVQTTVVDSVRISGLPGTSQLQPSPSSNLSQVPVTCVAQPPISSVQNSLSVEEAALYASSSQQAEVSASVHLTTSVAMAHSAPSLPAASSACSPAVAPSVVHTAVSNPVTPSQPLSVIATQSSSAHTPSPSPLDTSAGGQPAVERRREGSEEAKVAVSEGMSQPGGSETVSQTSPSSSKADPYMSLSSPSTRNNSASPNASPDNKDPSEGDENSNHSDSGICNDISPDMGTSQGSLLDSTGNKVYNHDSGIGSSSERSDDTPSEPGDNEYRSSHMGTEKEECSKSQKLVNCKQEAKVITVGYVMNNDHHSALNKDKNDLAAVQELKDRVPSLVRGDESHHGPNQLTVNVVHLAGKDQKNLVEPVKSMAQSLAPSHVFNSQQEPMKNGPQGEKKSVSPPTEDVRCRKQVQPDSRAQNHAHAGDEESSLKDSPVQQSNMALAPATSRHLLSNGPVTKSPEEASEADKHHPDMEICSEQPPPASTLRNDTTQASESMELAEDQPAHLMPEDEVSEMKEVARLAFNAQLVPEGQALAVEGAAGLLDGRYQARSPREMMEVEGGRTSPSGVGRGRGSPPESLRGSNITSMYSKQSVPVNVNLLNHIYSAGLPPPRRLTESVQRLVKPLPSIDSGMPQMRSCKSPGNTAPKQASSMSGSSPRSIHSGARSPGASARAAVEGKLNSSAAGVSMPNSLPYLQHGGGGPTTAVAYSPGMSGVSVASSTAYSGSPMTLVPPLTAFVQGLNQAPRSLCEVSQPSMELLEQNEGLDSAAMRVVPTIPDKPTHVMFSINVSRASDAPLCAVAETVMSSQTATSTCSPQASSHPNPHLHPLLPKPKVQSNPLLSDPVPSSCNHQCEDGVSRTAGAVLPASIHPTPSSCAMNHNVSSSASDLGHSTVGHNSSVEGLVGHISLPEPAVMPVSASNAVAPATSHAGVLVGESQSGPKDSGPSQTLPSVQHSTCTATHNFAEVLRRMASPTVHPAPVPPTAPPPPTPPLPSVSIAASSQAHVDSEAMSLGSEVHPPLPPPPPTPPPPPPLPTDPYPHSSEMDSSGVTECTEVSISDAPGSGSADFSAAASVSRIEETVHLSQTAAGNRDLSGTEANGTPNGSSSDQQSSNLCTSKAAESECDRQMQDTLNAVPATASHPAVVAGQPSNDSHGAPSVQSDPAVSIQPPTSVSDLPAQQARPPPAPSQDSTTNSTRSVPMEVDQTPVAPPAKRMKVEKSDSVSSESSVQVSQAPTVSGETVKSVKVSKTVGNVTKTNPKGSGGKNKGSAVPVKTETVPPAMVDVEMTPDPRHSEAQGKVPVSIGSQSSSSSNRGPAPPASEKGGISVKAEQAAPSPPAVVAAPLPAAAAGKAGQNGAAAKTPAAPQTPAASPMAKTGVSPKATTKADPAASSAKQPPSQAQKEGHSQQEGKKSATASTGMKTRESPGRVLAADMQKKEPAANATGAPATTTVKSAASLPPPLVSKPSESAPAPSTGSSEEQHAERPVRMTRKRRRTQSDSEPEHTPASLPVTASSTTSTSAAPSISSSTAPVPNSAAPSSTSTSTPALAAALMAPTLMDTRPDVSVSTVASPMETEKAAAPSTEGHTGSGMRLRETRRHSSGSETKHRSSSEEASESTTAEKTAVEKNVVEKTLGEKNVVEKSHVEKHAEKSAAEKHAGENSSEKAAAEKGAAEKKMDGASKEEELGRKTAPSRRQRGMPTSGQSYFQCLIMQGRTRSQSAPKGEKEKDKEKESKEQNQPAPPAPAKEDAAAAVPTTTAASGAASAAAAPAPSEGQKRPTRNLRQKDTADQQPAAKRRRPRDPR